MKLKYVIVTECEIDISKYVNQMKSDENPVNFEDGEDVYLWLEQNTDEDLDSFDHICDYGKTYRVIKCYDSKKNNP
ncbi:hypothetical protein [Cyanothece sp. BG0011]|uniref:hypothetical protein n=1 Tax=Cyanothece sp. BG0011 TaxID=2082950 RepID=UPI000D1D8A83|nr:hypothetical protein [Cyanothece sp. BG0011]